MDSPAAAAVDPQGNVFIAGSTNSGDFPVTLSFGPVTGAAAFVVKLDEALSRILAATKLGGRQFGGPNHAGTAATALAVDNTGTVYITGSTDALDFPTTPGAFQLSPPRYDAFGGAVYSFFVKLSSDLQHLLFSTYFGGNQATCSGGSACIGQFGRSIATAVAVVPAGNPVIAGYTTASDLPTTAGALARQCICTYQQSAGFVSKFSSDGSKLVWSTFVNVEAVVSDPLTSDIRIKALSLDVAGNVLIAGSAPKEFPVTAGA